MPIIFSFVYLLMCPAHSSEKSQSDGNAGTETTQIPPCFNTLENSLTALSSSFTCSNTSPETTRLNISSGKGMQVTLPYFICLMFDKPGVLSILSKYVICSFDCSKPLVYQTSNR